MANEMYLLNKIHRRTYIRQHYLTFTGVLKFWNLTNFNPNVCLLMAFHNQIFCDKGVCNNLVFQFVWYV